MRSYFFPIFFCLFLVACTDTEYKKHIVGQWSGTEWLTEGRPSGNNASDAYFSFAEDKSYTYRYGSHEEKGKYFISNNQLHTTPEGGITMMVKIVRLNEDSLVFDMNRGGQAEQLTLVRQ